MSTMTSDCHRFDDFFTVSVFGAGLAMDFLRLINRSYSFRIFLLSSSYGDEPLWVELRFSARCGISENFRQTLMVDRFHQMMIESRVARWVTVFLSTPARLGDQSDVTKLRPVAKLAREIVTIDAGRTDIDQGKIRKELLHDADSTGGVVGDAYQIGRASCR